MLVLTRLIGEVIVIGDKTCTIKVLETKRGKTKLGIACKDRHIKKSIVKQS